MRSFIPGIALRATALVETFGINRPDTPSALLYRHKETVKPFGRDA
jgi:hypothetical protein